MKIQNLRAINALVQEKVKARQKLGVDTPEEFGWMIGHITACICPLIDNPNKVFLPDIVRAVRNDANKILGTNF